MTVISSFFILEFHYKSYSLYTNPLNMNDNQTNRLRGKGGQQPHLHLRCQRQPGLCQYRPHQAGRHIGFNRSRAQTTLGRGEPPDGFR